MNFNFKKVSYFKIFLFLSWLGIIASINSSSNDFKSLNLNFISIINFLRYLAPIFIFLILLFFFLINIKKLNINYLFNFFILLGIIQFISFFFNGYSIFELHRYHILLLYFSTIFILLFGFKTDIDFKYLYIIFIALLSAVVISYIYALIKQTLELGKLNYFYYIFSGILQNNEYGIIGQQNPRSTGLSRQMTIIFCFLFYLMNSLNSKRFLYFLIFLILFLLSFFIWGLQSRGSLICFFILWLVFLFFDSKKFFSKISLFLILVLIPIFLFEYSIKMQIKNEAINVKTDTKNKVVTKKNRLLESKHFKVDIRIMDEKTGEYKTERRLDYTTGRIYIWQRALKAFLKKPFLGYGPQGDRIALIRDKTNIPTTSRHIWDNNASNGLIYVGLCAGILGIIILLSIYLLFLINILKSLFVLKVFKSNDFFIKNSVTLIIMFMIRSIYENSFTVFSIDFIVILISFSYIIKYMEKNNSQVRD